MKTTKLIVIIVFVVLSSNLPMNAQHLVVGATSELNVAGPQFGGTIAFEFKGLSSIGIFYQTELKKNSETLKSNTLSGVLLQVPLVKSEKLALLAKARLGLSNNHFLVAIPGLETRVGITERIGIALEMGMRMNYPSISGKIYTTIF